MDESINSASTRYIMDFAPMRLNTRGESPTYLEFTKGPFLPVVVFYFLVTFN